MRETAGRAGRKVRPGQEACQGEQGMAIKLMEALGSRIQPENLSARKESSHERSQRRRLRRQIGDVMSSHLLHDESIVRQFGDRGDRARREEALFAFTFWPGDRSGELAIADVLRAAEVDWKRWPAWPICIGDRTREQGSFARTWQRARSLTADNGASSRAVDRVGTAKS